MNNAVYDYKGKIIGYTCLTCYKIVPFMWGTKCNKCRGNK